jgi:hypothetical protein
MGKGERRETHQIVRKTGGRGAEVWGECWKGDGIDTGGGGEAEKVDEGRNGMWREKETEGRKKTASSKPVKLRILRRRRQTKRYVLIVLRYERQQMLPHDPCRCHRIRYLPLNIIPNLHRCLP